MAKQAAQTKEAPKSPEKEAVKVTTAQQKALDGMATWSAKIRYLAEQDYSRSEIAKLLGKRYQHVRNVLITPVAKAK